MTHRHLAGMECPANLPPNRLLWIIVFERQKEETLPLPQSTFPAMIFQAEVEKLHRPALANIVREPRREHLIG